MSDLWVLVPLKSLRGGKERLSGVLSESQRGELITAMASDLLFALLAVPIAPRHILLVSEDEAVQRLANLYGIGHFQPAPASSDPLNAALAAAAAHVAGQGGRTILIVHGDVPFAQAEDFRACIAAHASTAAENSARITLISDRAGAGTNCLLATPPTIIPLRFGAASREGHRRCCEDGAVAYRELSNPRLARDIDMPDDYDALVRDCLQAHGEAGAKTRAVVQGWSAAGG
jgi:2-phospho-L-lactate/phosphoenolpyruvate guanylyltransferase